MKKFSIAIFAFFSFILICRAEEGIFVSYKGLDNVHLQYDSGEVLGPATLKLKVIGKDGEKDLVEPVEIGAGKTGKLSGNVHHTDASNGTYTYKILKIDSNGTEVLLYQTTAIIDGKIIGTLLFDETISGDATIDNSVTVPSGKTLSINDGSLTEGKVYVYGTLDLSNATLASNIFDYGTISFRKGVVLGGGIISFYAPVDMDGVEAPVHVQLSFYSGSSDSIITNCKGSFVISLHDNASIYVDKSEISHFSMDAGTSLNIMDSIVSYSVSLFDSRTFNALGTAFLYPVTITGGDLEFTGCEFADYVYLDNRNKAEFTRCVFGSGLIFRGSSWGESGDQPTFLGNSFVGEEGPVFDGSGTPALKIDLGTTNYYGDKSPVLWDESSNRYWTFLTRGVKIDTLCFNVSQWSSSGPEMQNQKKLPDFWVNDYVIGQGCLPHQSLWGQRNDHTPIKGKETLLSLDIATNYTNVSGVKFKAYLDGDTKGIDPVNTNVVLYRDISSLGNDIFYGNTTVNFILPPTDKDSVSVSVTIDTTGIKGFDDATGKGEKSIFSTNLTFAPSYSRQLNILVQPVQLYIPGYTKSAPDGKAIEESLRKLIPAMLPISKQDLFIWTAPPTTFYGGLLSIVSTTALLNRIANSLAATQGFINTTAKVGDWLSGKETAKIDFVVAVLPKGVMGEGITGASLKLRRGVIFVDESNADAALHEMGHGIGLYTGEEQYDEYPDAGLQVEGLTAFISEESATKSFNGFRNRFLHFPREEQSWYENKYWYDIMGSSTTLIWLIESTFSAFEGYFRSELGSKTKSDNYKQVKIPNGYKRIFVSAEIKIPDDSMPGYGYYLLIPDTISVFDITEIATRKIDVPVDISQPGELSWSDDYKLECYDSSGNIIQGATQQFTTISPYIGSDRYGWPKESSFCGTFDIPENTETIKIFPRIPQWGGGLVWDTEPIFVLTSSPSPSITITSPSSGTLSDSVEISWTPQATKQAGGAMQYVVMVSTDGGETWVPIGAPTTSTSLTIPTDFLPASNNIIFKVVGSTGLDSNSAEISNLTIENRKPKAIIISPENGCIGDTQTKWILKGYGSDNEDGIIPTGEWTSSIDGQLNTETEIILSRGVHRLTFKVTDSGGLTDESSVVVEVKEEVEEIDLSLNEESLTLLIPGRDPLNTSSIVWLEKGKEHRAILKIKNTGIDTIFNASLYLKKPKGEEQLLKSGYFTPGIFEEVVLSETFIVEEEGQYEIRGEITNITPPDTNTSNNGWIWTYQTQPNNPVIEVLPETLDFGSVTKRTNGIIIIRNHGGEALIITSLTIIGSNEFSVDKSIINTSIPEGNSVIVPTYFDPRTIGEKEAILTITSNDQGKPTTEITLKGECLQVSGITGDISGDNLVDILDVILCLRMAIKLDPVDTSLGDINGDGEVDISDVILILRKAIGLE